jgi:hypothetical protein
MFTRNTRNQYDKKDSLELGQSAESRFASIAQRKGWAVLEASKEGNIEDHYDYEILKEFTIRDFKTHNLNKLLLFS